MNDDGRLVGALVQRNEVILHHAPESPRISLDCRDPRAGRRAFQTRDERLRRGHDRGDRSLRLILLLATLRACAATPAGVTPRPAFQGTPGCAGALRNHLVEKSRSAIVLLSLPMRSNSAACAAQNSGRATRATRSRAGSAVADVHRYDGSELASPSALHPARSASRAGARTSASTTGYSTGRTHAPRALAHLTAPRTCWCCVAQSAAWSGPCARSH